MSAPRTMFSCFPQIYPDLSHSNLENNPTRKKDAGIANTIEKARPIFQDGTQTYPVFDWEGSFTVMDSSSGP